MLKVEKVITGYLEENCYIIHNGISGLIIDPGADGEKIVTKVNSLNINIKGILITHYHFDHVGALDFVKNAFSIDKVVDYKNKGNMIIDTFSFKVVETFGHYMDSCSFFFDNDNMLFSGDFVFKEDIGNYEEDCYKEMVKSFQIFKYMDKDVIIYPGHGSQTTVGYELNNNPFLKGI